jgi:hypothetical protein
MIAKSILMLALLAASPALATQLQGEQRTQMIELSKSKCLNNNIKKPENRGYKLAVVDAFCACVGTGAVDSFSIEELEAAATEMTADFVKRRAAFTNKCGDDTLAKAKK